MYEGRPRHSGKIFTTPVMIVQIKEYPDLTEIAVYKASYAKDALESTSFRKVNPVQKSSRSHLGNYFSIVSK